VAAVTRAATTDGEAVTTAGLTYDQILSINIIDFKRGWWAL
jgi:hypothetical protein